jgi:hypothetical protein
VDSRGRKDLEKGCSTFDGFNRSLTRLDEVGDVKRHLLDLGVAEKVSIVRW